MAMATCGDLEATISRFLGFDHTRISFPNTGIEGRPTDVPGDVIEPVLA